MTSKGTDRRTIRVDADLWERFGEWAKDYPGGSSGALRACMRFLLGDEGAELPRRDGQQAADDMSAERPSG